MSIPCNVGMIGCGGTATAHIEAIPLTSCEEDFQTFRLLFAADQSAAEGRSIQL